MICLMEPECRGWQHEMVNSGFLKMILDSFPDEQVVVACEREHFRCITVKLAARDIERILYQEIKLNFDSSDASKEYTQYEHILHTCLHDYPQITSVVLLSSHRANMKAVKVVAKEYERISFTVVVHAIMEKLIRKSGIRTFCEHKRYAVSLARTLHQLGALSNVNFVIYNPCLREYTRKILSDETVDKFYFIHHPYIYERGGNESGHKGVRVGIVGACNQHAPDIVDKSTCTRQSHYVSMTGGMPYSKTCNVEYINNGSRITRDELEVAMYELDYLLIPYNGLQYRISASGVLFDSMNYRKPMLMLNSPLLKYYNDRFDIGYSFASSEELALFVNSIFAAGELSKDYTDKVENIENAIVVMNRENKEWIRNIISL